VLKAEQEARRIATKAIGRDHEF